jgi:hypothetical protein
MNDQQLLAAGLEVLTSGQIVLGFLLLINIGLLVYLIALVNKKR